MRIFAWIVAALMAMPMGAQTTWQDSMLKPRLVVCTDIAPADVEPDDMESMVHLMAYADMFEIEALITSVGWNCDPYPMEWSLYMYRVMGAYATDVKNLMKRSGQKEFLSMEQENARQRIGYWPSAEYVTSRVVMGSTNGGIRSIGEQNDSPGSNLLIRLADEDDPRPIYVAAWGGANTLAQAIWKVKQTRSADEVRNFVHTTRLLYAPDGLSQRVRPTPCCHIDGPWVVLVSQSDEQFAAWRVVLLSDGTDAAIRATHHDATRDIFRTGPVANPLTSVFLLHRQELLLS